MMETGTGSQIPIPNGQILPQLIMEAKAASGLDIHHINEDSDDKRVKDMLENYTSHIFQQQKQKSLAMSQQFRQFIPSISTPSLPPTSHSHPCLFMIDETKRHGRASDEIRQSPHPTMIDQTINDLYDPPSYSNGPVFYQESSQNITPPNTTVVKMSDLSFLKNENEMLRKKVESLEQKVGKLRQLEQVYDRIEKDFEQVLNQRDQQEKIEKLALTKMEQHIQRLTADNSILLQRLETLNNLNSQQEMLPQPAPDNMQLAQLTMLLNEYVAQNKELQNSNDRQKIELEAQTVTLNEQTNHIVMLEKALSNAQERLAAKDRQLMDNNIIVERCQHLQKLLQESIEDKQRRQEEFNKEKAQLEMEIAMAKVQKDSPSPRKNRTSPEPDEKIKKIIHTKDEQISQLESTILQLQRKFGDDKHKKEIFLKAEVENLNACYRKVELEKLEKDRRIQELLNENRKLHEKLIEERHLMDRRFLILEEDVRKLSIGKSTNSNLFNNSPPSLEMTRQYQISGFTPMTTAMSVSSLQHFEKDPIFTRQRNYFGDPNGKMEELRRNIAEKRNQRSLSRPRMPGSAPMPQREETVTNNNGHYRASSGPSSVIHSTKLNQYESQAEMERQISEYMASLPATTRRRFAVATGLDEKDFVPSQLYQVTHNVTPSLPEGTKLPLSRQISKGSSASSSSKRQMTSLTPSDPNISKEKDLSSIRIHLIEPSTDSKLESDDSEELRSPSGSSGSQTPSEPEEPQTPASGVSAASFSNNLIRNAPPIYSFDVQTPQSITQIHTTTVVEVNKDQLNDHRHLKKQQKSLNYQSNSIGNDPTSNI